MVAARQKGIDVLHRSEVLAQLLNSRRGIAVSGAHGKTTVTSMIALCLEMAGTDPTVLIGAISRPLVRGPSMGAAILWSRKPMRVMVLSCAIVQRYLW